MMTDDVMRSRRDELLVKVRGMLLGAAVGDALGWPQEMAGARSSARRQRGLPYDAASFKAWDRKAGGRFWARYEEIRPGEYSDDTQLLLATARSLEEGEGWWQHLTQRELPVWPLYERGGGRASKAAARSWLAGSPPWLSQAQKDRHAYFNSGGNGAAMRIAPHSVRGAETDISGVTVASIMADSICTHGHPRALLGAIVYGFAVWYALRQSNSLPYGQLVKLLLEERATWSHLPSVDELTRVGVPLERARGWYRSAEEEAIEPGGTYKSAWSEVVDEIVLALRRCGEALEDGALADNTLLLRELGCFDRNRNGAGSVSAVAAIYMSSIFAADPLNGVVEAAFAHGADTDTLASMTGGLLGAINGYEWLGSLGDDVQDSGCLTSTAEKLVRLASATGVPNTRTVGANERVTQADLDRLTTSLVTSEGGTRIVLPDGRAAVVTEFKTLRAESASVRTQQWCLLTDDGQRLYVNKSGKVPPKADNGVVRQMEYTPVQKQRAQLDQAQTIHQQKSTPVRLSVSANEPTRLLNGRTAQCTVLMAVVLPVANVLRTRQFYADVLGLASTTARNGSLRVGAAISFRSAAHAFRPYGTVPLREHAPLVPGSLGTGQELNLQTDDLESTYRRVQASGARILEGLSERGGRSAFRCLDPDGYIVHVYEESGETSIHVPSGDTETLRRPESTSIGTKPISQGTNEDATSDSGSEKPAAASPWREI